ncbi:MAG: UbiD family decarboxylase [Chloroflexi bacterium]|nr:UbiD family decarboxylase [Chloroflexota bacterium]
MADAQHRVAYTDMREFIELLDAKGLVHRVTAEVDPVHELGAITARSLDRHGPAIIFENVKGYPNKPMVVNLLSTPEQVALAFGTEPTEEQVQGAVVRGMDHRLPSLEVETGPCKDVILMGDDADLNFIPTPVWHEHDGGQFLATTAGIVTRDPLPGILNVGLYRTMIKDKHTMSLAGGIRGRASSTGPGGGDHILDNEAVGKPTPIAVIMGTDPLVTLAAGSPVRPNGGELEGSMEYEAADGWRGEGTKLVKCETSDLLVPADAEVVIEGFVVPNERTSEGPWKADKVAAEGVVLDRTAVYELGLKVENITPVSLEDKTRLVALKQVVTQLTTKALLDASESSAQEEVTTMVAKMLMAWGSGNTGLENALASRFDTAPLKNGLCPKCSQTLDWTPETKAIDTKTMAMVTVYHSASLKFKDNEFPPVNKVSRELTAKVAARWDELGLP